MKSIYILRNYDTDENICASEDKELLQEMLYDMYLQDAYEEFCYRLTYSHSPTPHVAPIAAESWENIDDYYRSYMAVEELDVI